MTDKKQPAENLVPAEAVEEAYARGHTEGFEAAQRAHAETLQKCGSNACTRRLRDWDRVVIRDARVFCRRFCAEFGF